MKIAIADDNQKILDLLDRVIGMEKDMNLVGKAKNGEEMCQIIKDKQPDVVLLDLIMPKMDGLTVMDRINHDKTVSKHPYFIVITAVGQEKITDKYILINFIILYTMGKKAKSTISCFEITKKY